MCETYGCIKQSDFFSQNLVNHPTETAMVKVTNNLLALDSGLVFILVRS